MLIFRKEKMHRINYLSFYLKNLEENSGATGTLQDCCLRYHLAVSYKVKYAFIIQPSNGTSRYKPKKNMGIYAHRVLYTSVYSSVIEHQPNCKQSKYPSTGKWVNILVILTVGCFSAAKGANY